MKQAVFKMYKYKIARTLGNDRWHATRFLNEVDKCGEDGCDLVLPFPLREDIDIFTVYAAWSYYYSGMATEGHHKFNALFFSSDQHEARDVMQALQDCWSSFLILGNMSFYLPWNSYGHSLDNLCMIRTRARNTKDYFNEGAS